MLRVFEKNETNFLSNGLCALPDATDARVTEAINGVSELTFSLPADSVNWQHIKCRNIVNCEGQLFRVAKREYMQDTAPKRTVSCAHVLGDAADKFIPYFPDNEIMAGTNAREVMELAFEGTSFNVLTDIALEALGMEWVTEPLDFFQQSLITPLGIMQKLLDTLEKGELYINNYDIAIVKRIGRDTGVRLSNGLNVRNANDTEDASEVITRLYVFGKDGLGLPASAAPNGYIESQEGIERWGVVEGYRSYSDIDDKNKLLQKAQYCFSEDNPERLDMPARNYQASILDIAKLHGDGFKIGLGDTVNIIDGDDSIKTRAVAIEAYPYEPQKTTITFGTPMLTIGEALNQTVKTGRDYKNTLDSSGRVQVSWIQNLIKNLRTRVNELLQSREVVLHKTGDVWINPNNPDKALCLTDSYIAIANGKNADGDWNWTTFGSADGFTADAINSGTLNAGQVTVKSEKHNGNEVIQTEIGADGLAIKVNGEIKAGVGSDGRLSANVLALPDFPETYLEIAANDEGGGQIAFKGEKVGNYVTEASLYFDEYAGKGCAYGFLDVSRAIFRLSEVIQTGTTTHISDFGDIDWSRDAFKIRLGNGKTFEINENGVYFNGGKL